MVEAPAEAWQNFYVMAGGAAAALVGLILVALSLHLRAILGHPSIAIGPSRACLAS